MSKKYIKGKPFVPEASRLNRYELAADKILGLGANSKPKGDIKKYYAQKLWCKNSTGAALTKGEVVYIGNGVPWGGTTTDQEIQTSTTYPAVSALAPVDNEFGQWGVVVDSIPVDGLGQVYVDGVFWARTKRTEVGRYLEMEAGSTVLACRASPFNASAEIIQGPVGASWSDEWALVRYLGFRAYTLFAVTVTKVSGVAGSSTAACTFKYDVNSIETPTKLNTTSLSPQFQRPALGKMTAATKGLAYFDDNNDVYLHSVDEVFSIVKCADTQT